MEDHPQNPGARRFRATYLTPTRATEGDILVTGAEGLVGSALVIELRSRGELVRCLDLHAAGRNERGDDK